MAVFEYLAIVGAALLIGAVTSLFSRRWRRAVLLAVPGVVCILAVLPVLLHPVPRSTQAMNESKAIGELRAVMASEYAYQSSNNGSFGCLSCLAAPTSCGFADGTTPFIDPAIASLALRAGYSWSFTAGSRKPGVPDVTGIASYAFVAVPTKPGVTGQRGFCGDDTGRLCYTTDGTAPNIKDGRCAEPCNVLR